ncbi:unnamed protein product [Diatraea saccharalis]|uniref:Prisilkin-39-like n=1 Tax=Diatraea saccharalis TaxID=40085 RepID=A0A9N9R7E5_9NEOP|nr:unnamed protein product [Diatraea saccharalis]
MRVRTKSWYLFTGTSASERYKGGDQRSIIIGVLILEQVGRVLCYWTNIYNELFAVSAQRLTETSTEVADGQRRSVAGAGGYGLLRPNYGSNYGGYGSNYGGYGSNYGGYGGGPPYSGGFGGYNGGYGGSHGGYPYQPYPGYGGGYRPNYRPGYDYRPGYNYPGAGYSGYNRPSFTPYRPGYDRQYPNNPGNYFGGYSDSYNDNIRLLGRKVGETKKEES